jgi:hypothetical protein
MRCADDASHGGLPARARNDESSLDRRLRGSGMTGQRSLAPPRRRVVRQKQSEAERRCMQPMAPPRASVTGRAGRAASGCASQTEGWCMHNSASISPSPIGGGGGVLRCMDAGARPRYRRQGHSAHVPDRLRIRASACTATPTTRASFPRLQRVQQVSRRRSTPFSALVCSFRSCPSACSSPARPPLELSGQALVWSLGQLLSLQASFAGRS